MKHIVIVAINIVALVGFFVAYFWLVRRLAFLLPSQSIWHGPVLYRAVGGLGAMLLMAVWIASSLAW